MFKGGTKLSVNIVLTDKDRDIEVNVCALWWTNDIVIVHCLGFMQVVMTCLFINNSEDVKVVGSLGGYF